MHAIRAGARTQIAVGAAPAYTRASLGPGCVHDAFASSLNARRERENRPRSCAGRRCKRAPAVWRSRGCLTCLLGVTDRRVYIREGAAAKRAHERMIEVVGAYICLLTRSPRRHVIVLSTRAARAQRSHVCSIYSFVWHTSPHKPPQRSREQERSDARLLSPESRIAQLRESCVSERE